jgi:hypothetical protein
MSTAKLSDDLAQLAVDAVAVYGSKIAAARALQIAVTTLKYRCDVAKDRGIKASVVPLTSVVASSNAELSVTSAAVEEANKLKDEVKELAAQLKSVRANTIDGEYVKRKIIGIKNETAGVEVPDWLLSMPRGKALPGCPVAMWSDWHWGEVVFPDQVNGVNEFNLVIASKRARRLVERTIYLLQNHVVNPEYPGLVLNLGGDMLSGDIHDELKESNDVPLPKALLDVYGVLIWCIKQLVEAFGRVLIPCVTGNHGRMSRKPQAKNRNFTNYDWLLYQLLSKHFEDDARVQFYIPDGPDALYSVYGHKILLTHGDQFRGGDGIIGAIGPITRGNQKKLARNTAINRAYDTMVIGHWHQYMPLHRTLVNGSLKGYDEYANSNNFGFEPPIQALWLQHPQHGIIMHLPVYLEPHPTRAEGSAWVQWQDRT